MTKKFQKKCRTLKLHAEIWYKYFKFTKKLKIHPSVWQRNKYYWQAIFANTQTKGSTQLSFRGVILNMGRRTRKKPFCVYVYLFILTVYIILLLVTEV
jgi:hypothetical protein